MEVERYVSPKTNVLDSDLNLEKQPNIRPAHFDDYPGQSEVKENLKTYVKAAKKRKCPLDHLILHGPPGLGKTTLAQIVANELAVTFFQTSGPSIDKPGDLAGILTGMADCSVLFIDEIHRLNIQVEEVLYSAMEDYCLDLLVGQGPTARTVRMPIKPFTLIGATTKLSSLSRPFLSRFGIQERLNFYNNESLELILNRSASVFNIRLDVPGAKELAKRSRGTPRIANRLLRRVWDFAEVSEKSEINQGVVKFALKRLDIDVYGLDKTDREILRTIGDNYKGGPVGIDTLAVTLGEDKSTLEEVYEPYLVHSGFVRRGARGRSLTEKALNHLMKWMDEEDK